MIGADDDQRSHGSVKNLGVVANLLLLVGDFATTGARSAFVASRSPLAKCCLSFGSHDCLVSNVENLLRSCAPVWLTSPTVTVRSDETSHRPTHDGNSDRSVGPAVVTR
jgi:hypothetical protein